jgi:hypothetical protein
LICQRSYFTQKELRENQHLAASANKTYERHRTRRLNGLRESCFICLNNHYSPINKECIVKKNKLIFVGLAIITLLTSTGAAAQDLENPDSEWELTTVPMVYNGQTVDAYGTALDEEAGLLFINGRSGYVLAIDITGEDYEIVDGFKAANCQGGDSFGDTVLHDDFGAIIEVDEAGGFTFINADQDLVPTGEHFMYSLGTKYGCGYQQAFRMELLKIENDELAVTVGTTGWPPGYARIYSLDRTGDVFTADLLDQINAGWSVHWVAVAPNNRTVAMSSFNSTYAFWSPLMVRDVIPDGSGSYQWSEEKPGIPRLQTPYQIGDLEFDPNEDNNRLWVSSVRDGLYEYSWWVEGSNGERNTQLIQTNWWPEIGTLRYMQYNEATDTIFAVENNFIKIISMEIGTATLVEPPIIIPAIWNLGHISVNQAGDTVYIPDRGGYLHILKKNTPIECPEVGDVSPDEVEEGSLSYLTAAATEPNGTVSFAWDLDNDGIFETEGNPIEFPALALNGPSTEEFDVVAYDQVCTLELALENGTTPVSITIDNVPPVILLPDEVVLIEGEFLDVQGSFTDPGPEAAWTGLIDYDLGGGLQDLPLDQATKTFSLYAQYLVPQENPYDVEVKITDDTEPGEKTILVTVLSYQDAADDLIEDIEDWIDAGEISNGEGQSLIPKLNALVDSIENENSQSALSKLEILQKFVEGQIKKDKIPQELGEMILELILRISATL